ncbi:hypothetical protein BCV72DRAFT_305404 [Rhizopus microsporus var. microsporus]|uniref:Uncharacterized protein n=1 Tax=Rhizopus microsporus var. microsporus TaxID=86635 RepID=A0A1X0R3N6_RHIZD|nr:hypothetical protein BCV72DRAFT_305404 [Rhizopus microsporus var. microsporus]
MTFRLQRQNEIKGKRAPFSVCTNARKLTQNLSFEASDDNFQETPLLRKGKNARTTLKASKEEISACGHQTLWYGVGFVV